MAKEKHFAPPAPEMSLEEAKAYRASLARPVIEVLNENQKREEFRKFWTQAKKSYGKGKNLESILWVHLKSIGCDTPDKFEQGIANFGFKQVK